MSDLLCSKKSRSMEGNPVARGRGKPRKTKGEIMVLSDPCIQTLCDKALLLI